MRKYDERQKNCILLPIYVDKNLGNMCGMAPNGVGSNWKENKVGLPSQCGSVVECWSMNQEATIQFPIRARARVA